MIGRKTLKQFLTAVMSGIVILTACAPAGTATPVFITQEATATPSPIPTSTNTSLPTETPTASITPLPTIPTFTPTFDASTIVTVTPAPKAECLKEDHSLKPDFEFDNRTIGVEQKILDFLNEGGSIQKITTTLARTNNSYRLIDVTNDGNSDLILGGFLMLDANGFPVAYDTFYILSCRDGQYSLFSGEHTIGVASLNTIYDVIDMNANGIPEIIIYNNKCSGGGCYSFFVGEWNGKTFVDLAHNIFLDSIIDGKIQDTNNDGTLELILIGGLYDRSAPWRSEIHTYMWNGKYFLEQPIEYIQPVYRFQAVQDADNAVLVGKYSKATQLYEAAISAQNLEWWSRERQEYENAVVAAPWTHEPTPSVKPSEDKAEYPRLAAYAYYRIMLIHLVEGNEVEAETVYKTLQEKFGNDPYGQPYVELATAFWNAYQSTHKMYDGCAAAIQYAAEHPEILIPLGSDYHGSQSHIYVPADVCPFR